MSDEEIWNYLQDLKKRIMEEKIYSIHHNATLIYNSTTATYENFIFDDKGRIQKRAGLTWDYFTPPNIPPAKPPQGPKCSCGTSKTMGKDDHWSHHSDWCDVYKANAPKPKETK
jgi:hypothetical protein